MYELCRVYACIVLVSTGPIQPPDEINVFFIYKCRLLCACYFRYSRSIVLYLIRFVCSHVLAFGIASSGQKTFVLGERNYWNVGTTCSYDTRR